MEEANVASITETMSGERVLMSNLTIESAQPSDAGDYTCVAENEVNNTSATATLVVHGELLYAIASFTTSLMMQWFPPSPSLLMVTPSTPMSSPLQCSSAQPLVHLWQYCVLIHRQTETKEQFSQCAMCP